MPSPHASAVSLLYSPNLAESKKRSNLTTWSKEPESFKNEVPPPSSRSGRTVVSVAPSEDGTKVQPIPLTSPSILLFDPASVDRRTPKAASDVKTIVFDDGKALAAPSTGLLTTANQPTASLAGESPPTQPWASSAVSAKQLQSQLPPRPDDVVQQWKAHGSVYKVEGSPPPDHTSLVWEDRLGVRTEGSWADGLFSGLVELQPQPSFQRSSTCCSPCIKSLVQRS